MKNKKLIILGGLAILGVFGTAIASSWGSFKAAEKIREVKPKGKLETVKTVWKYYVPAGLALGITIVSDICVYRIGMKEIAALSGTVAYLTANRRKFEEKVKEVSGEDKLNEIKKEVNKDLNTHTVGLVNPVDVQDTGYGKTLCRFSCDYFTIWFRSDPEEVMTAINTLQERWSNKEYIGFIEFLDDLHIHLKPAMEWMFNDFGWPASSPGCCPGFSENSDISIETDMLEGYVNGEEVFTIDLYTSPFECYLEY